MRSASGLSQPSSYADQRAKRNYPTTCLRDPSYVAGQTTGERLTNHLLHPPPGNTSVFTPVGWETKPLGVCHTRLRPLQMLGVPRGHDLPRGQGRRRTLKRPSHNYDGSRVAYHIRPRPTTTVASPTATTYEGLTTDLSDQVLHESGPLNYAYRVYVPRKCAAACLRRTAKRA